MIEVIAEIANTHQGDPDYAYKLAKTCQRAGADAIKFQIYFAEELLTKTHPKFQHFKNISNAFAYVCQINTVPEEF